VGFNSFDLASFETNFEQFENQFVPELGLMVRVGCFLLFIYCFKHCCQAT
jgi:hypothetical protein